MSTAGGWLLALDAAIVAVFTVEVALRLFARGPRFFLDGWNLFDFAIIALTLAPATGNLSVLRTFRILRVLRIISVVPRLRQRSEEHTSELQSLMRISYAVLCL